MAVSNRVAERLRAGLKEFVPVLAAQKARDVSEADTITLVKDVLAQVFGYDKYAELTSEFAIRGTYCDLAVKIDGKLQILIEVKAIGQELKDQHVKQAVDYATNQGVEWVILTNSITWTLYHVLFKKPIDKDEVCTISLCDVNTRSEDDLEKLFLFTKEGVAKNALAVYRDRKDATSRYMLAAILLNSDSVQGAIRKEIRRVSELTIDRETIEQMLRDQVIKREAMDGDQADSAARRFRRNQERPSQTKAAEPDPTAAPTSPAAVTE